MTLEQNKSPHAYTKMLYVSQQLSETNGADLSDLGLISSLYTLVVTWYHTSKFIMYWSFISSVKTLVEAQTDSGIIVQPYLHFLYYPIPPLHHFFPTVFKCLSSSKATPYIFIVFFNIFK